MRKMPNTQKIKYFIVLISFLYAAGTLTGMMTVPKQRAAIVTIITVGFAASLVKMVTLIDKVREE